VSSQPATVAPTVSFRPRSRARIDPAARAQEANLFGVDLDGAYLSKANFRGADLSGVELFETVVANVDLTTTKGLATCDHVRPSAVDHRTLERSTNVPVDFWRGCGLPEWQIATIKLYHTNMSLADDRSSEPSGAFVTFGARD